MEFVYVEGGCFQMGDLFGDGFPDEKPVREVCVEAFFLAKTPVTQGQWQKIMECNPAMFKKGPDYPVEMVCFDDTQTFINRLNQLTEGGYRLPTEAEWEFAARGGGLKQKWSGTSSLDELGDYAWYGSNANGRTHPVGLKKPNELGIYDMSGIVHEWVEDFYDHEAFTKLGRDNPIHTGPGRFRAFRGGSWKRHPEGLRCTRRMGGQPNTGFGTYGVRLARSVGYWQKEEPPLT
ncbi:MAG: formylglycine-generating enzyme family protein [Magnetococcales bacterium]|nr:formylglycine-generating enzyme family protein [Magnetococcales bacterium]